MYLRNLVQVLASSDGESAMGGIEFTPLSRLISCPTSINSYSVISYIARLIAADAAETRETYCLLHTRPGDHRCQQA